MTRVSRRRSGGTAGLEEALEGADVLEGALQGLAGPPIG